MDIGIPSSERNFKSKSRQKWRKKGAVLKLAATLPREDETAKTHTLRDPPQSPPPLGNAKGPSPSIAVGPDTPSQDPASAASSSLPPGDSLDVKPASKSRFRHHPKWHNKPHKGRHHRQKSTDASNEKKEEQQQRDDLPTASKVEDAKARVLLPGVKEDTASDSVGTKIDDAAPEKLPSHGRRHGHRGHRKAHWHNKKHSNVGRASARPQLEPKENADKLEAATRSGNQATDEKTSDAVEGGFDGDAEDAGKFAADEQEISSSRSRHPKGRNNNSRQCRKSRAHPKKHPDPLPPPAEEGDEADKSPTLVTKPGVGSEDETKEGAESIVVRTNAAGAAILSRLASGGKKDQSTANPTPLPPMSYAEAAVATQTSSVAESMQTSAAEVGFANADEQVVAPYFVPYPTIVYDGTAGYDAVGAAVPPVPVNAVPPFSYSIYGDSTQFPTMSTAQSIMDCRRTPIRV